MNEHTNNEHFGAIVNVLSTLTNHLEAIENTLDAIVTELAVQSIIALREETLAESMPDTYTLRQNILNAIRQGD